MSILIRFVLLVFLSTVAACGGGEPEVNSCQRVSATTESGLEYRDIECGTGTEAANGSTLTVRYVGRLSSGKEFDSSRAAGGPFRFALGAGQVIEGWDQGLVGMKVGGTRELTVPPELAHGEEGAPPVIPPNVTLIFEVELLDVAETD